MIGFRAAELSSGTHSYERPRHLSFDAYTRWRQVFLLAKWSHATFHTIPHSVAARLWHGGMDIELMARGLASVCCLQRKDDGKWSMPNQAPYSYSSFSL